MSLTSTHFFNRLVWIPVCMSLMVQVVAATCRDDLFALPGSLYELIIDENTPKDTLLLNISTGDSLSVDTVKSPFLKVIDGKLYTSMDMALDGSDNEDLCSRLSVPINTMLKCKDEPSFSNIQKRVIVTMKYSNDHPTELLIKNVTIKEQTSNVAVIDLTKKEDFVRDDDCASNINLQVIMDPETARYFSTKPGPVVWIEKPLDYEKKTQYRVNVSASSQLPSQEMIIVVDELTINVEDVDDRDPVFEQQVYTMTVIENSQDNSQWLLTEPPLIATDGDSAIDTQLEYSIVSSDPPLDVEISENGTLRISRPLDREAAEAYTIIVKAQQIDNPLASSTATVSLTILDVNDNRPRFSSQQVKNVSILEGAPAGTHVVWLLAQDRDEGRNAEFKYSIYEDTGAFEVRTNPTINLTELVVKDPSLLQGLESAQVQIRVVETATPNGGETCDYVTSCGITISVSIEDINDHGPEFATPQYDLSIYSEQKADIVIEKVSATDKDKGANGEVLYSLKVLFGKDKPDCQKIRINATSGEVSLSQKIIPDITCFFSVVACDNPSNVNSRRCTTAPLVVSVLQSLTSNSSDEVLFYESHITENLPRGSLVMILPIDGLITENRFFTIEDRLLKTNVMFDREAQDFHIVAAGKWNGTQIIEILRIMVYIDNINDNTPVFARDDYEMRLTGKNKEGDVVYKVEAFDADGPNDTVTYSLLNMRDIFTIDSVTGQIRLVSIKEMLAAAISSQQNRSVLLVEARDSGMPALSNRAFVTVYFPSSVMVPVRKDELTNDAPEVKRQLSSILGVPVDVVGIESIGNVQNMGSKIYLSVTSENGTETTSRDELQRLIDDKEEEIHRAFAEAYGGTGDDNEDENNDEDWLSLPVIILLCLTIVFIIALILVIVAFCRARRQYERELSLMKSLNTDTSIYDRAPLYPELSTSSNGSSHAVALNNKSTNYNEEPPGGISLLAFHNQAYTDDEEGHDPGYSRISDRENRLQPNGQASRNVINNEILAGRQTSSAGSELENQPPARHLANRGHFESEDSRANAVDPIYSETRPSRHSGTDPIFKTTIDVVYPRHSSGVTEAVANNTEQTDNNIERDDVDTNWSFRRNSKLGLERSVNSGRHENHEQDESDGKLASPASSRLGQDSLKAGSESDSGLPSDKDLQLDDETDQEIPTGQAYTDKGSDYLPPYSSRLADATSTRNTHIDEYNSHHSAISLNDNNYNCENRSKDAFSDELSSFEPEPDYEKRVRFRETQRLSGMQDIPVSTSEEASDTQEKITKKSEVTAL
ncbi:protocadherin fat 4 [Plakobranchus ocellatus]|uniref:Protocadherin fat 4 n=1 Tax=Plakobranchus ocellatus TaxID=259542 RepID=A0AAV4AD17_9GAST|nr:protocadherin fat 4 [Plakobranchus ocellatus]